MMSSTAARAALRSGGRSRRSGHARRLAGIAFVLLSAGAGAQVLEHGPEFEVNSYTSSGGQRPSSIAFDSQGGFWVVWSSDGSPGDDDQATSIQARRFDAAGGALAPQFQVNSYTPGFQYTPRALELAGGDFLIAWSGPHAADADGGIVARRFDDAGPPIGGDVQLNSYTTGLQSSPDAAIDSDGEFVVVWSSFGSGGSDSDGASIQGRLFDASGVALGPDFQVNSTTTGPQLSPRVDRRPGGSFVVVWQSSNAVDNFGVRARRFAADGTPQGNDFLVGTAGVPLAYRPDVGVTDAGFVVAWNAYEQSSGPDTSQFSVQAQRFALNGVALGAEFQVNQSTPYYQWAPDIATDDGGGFVVVWESYGSSGDDDADQSVQLRRYAPTGAPRGGEFQVNRYTTSAQRYPIVARRGEGVIVSWMSVGSFGPDTDGQSVQARRLSLPFFEDGFESGTTALWSAAVP